MGLILAQYCWKCKRLLPVSMFRSDRSRGNGLAHLCNDCDNRRRVKRAREARHRKFFAESRGQ